MASMPAANSTVSSGNGQTARGPFMTAISIMRGFKTMFRLHFDVKLSRRFAIFLFATAMVGNAVAAPKDIETTACGLLIRFGEAQVELAAVNTNALRLSVSLNGAPQAIRSTFLDGTHASTPVAWRTVKRHGMVGVKMISGLSGKRLLRHRRAAGSQGDHAPLQREEVHDDGGKHFRSKHLHPISQIEW